MSTTVITKPTSIELVQDLVRTFDLRLSKVADHSLNLQKEAKKGLTPQLDEKIEKAIVAYKTTKSDFADKRMPITRKFDEIKKVFTEKERAIQNEIDILQAFRDTFAKHLAEENARKQREADKERLAGEELIRLRSDIEVEIREYVMKQIDTLKNGILQSLYTVTKENAEERFPKLQAMPTVISDKSYNAFKTAQRSNFGHNVANIVKEKLFALKDEMYSMYDREIGEYKQAAIANFKQVMEMTDEERKQSVEAAKDDILINSQTAMEVAKVQIEANEQAEQAELAFDSITIEDEIPENRQGFKINVAKKEAYASLVAYWFSVCAADLEADAFERKTIGSMIKDLEKHAHKTGEKLNNPNVSYEVVYKAINRKA